MKTFLTVPEYIASFPDNIQIILTKLREIVKEYAPSSEESISYGMPGYKLNGRPLIYFAAFKHHIGVYPTPSGIEAFSAKLSSYKTAKGSIQFPLDKSFPYELFGEIVQHRVKAL